MPDVNSQAAKTFYGLIRSFAEKTQVWEDAIRYEVKPDEAYDLSLISERVYGRRDEFLVIMAVAGIDTADEAITQKELVLPTDQQLYLIKRQSGFESIHKFRDNQKPTWEAT